MPNSAELAAANCAGVTTFFSAMNNASGLRSRVALSIASRAAASSSAPSSTRRRAMPVIPTRLAVATVAIPMPLVSPARLYPKLPLQRTDRRRFSGRWWFHGNLSRRGELMRISVIMPAKNEAEGLQRTLPALRATWPDAEVIVVDDGSTDATAAVAAGHGARVLSSPYSMGNGAAIKRGARAASGDVLVFMDADGQHDPAHIQQLLRQIEAGF